MRPLMQLDSMRTPATKQGGSLPRTLEMCSHPHQPPACLSISQGLGMTVWRKPGPVCAVQYLQRGASQGEGHHIEQALL